jgi:hypothetical protein
VYGSTRSTTSDEESWSDSGQWAEGTSSWADDEPDSGGWSADDPGYSERRWTDEEPSSYWRDDAPAAVYGTPLRPEADHREANHREANHPEANHPEANHREAGRPHKRRADVTAADLGYTGRRTKPDHHAEPQDDLDDGAYWRRIAADPDDW